MSELNEDQFNSDVRDLKNSNDKRYLIGILEYKLQDLRDQNEDPGCGLEQTAVIRGSILQIRELLDLLD